MTTSMEYSICLPLHIRIWAQDVFKNGDPNSNPATEIRTLLHEIQLYNLGQRDPRRLPTLVTLGFFQSQTDKHQQTTSDEQEQPTFFWATRTSVCWLEVDCAKAYFIPYTARDSIS